MQFGMKKLFVFSGLVSVGFAVLIAPVLRSEVRYRRQYRLMNESLDACSKAWTHCRAAEYELAIEDFSDAIRIEEQYSNPTKMYVSRGRIYLYLGNYQAALNDFDRAQIGNSPNAWTCYYRSEALRGLGQVAEADRIYKTATILGVQELEQLPPRGSGVPDPGYHRLGTSPTKGSVLDTECWTARRNGQ